MSTHNLTEATSVFYGKGINRKLQRLNASRGAPVNFLTKVSLGAPIVADDDYFINSATSTKLPNNATITYTTADDGTTGVLDNSATPVPETITTNTGALVSVWKLDVPRAFTATVTHNSSVVAMTITLTGYDKYDALMKETLTIAATGASQTAAGKKAFAYLYSVALTSAGNSTTNTVKIGVGDVIGLPYKLTSVSDCLAVFFDDAADSATVVKADTATATATTGDVRGTVNPNGVLNGSKLLEVWMNVRAPSTAAGLVGVNQYSG
jgi:hypothetical protein